MTLETPTPTQLERIAQAIVQKSTRILVMTQAPLGLWGTDSEFGSATVRPDYQTKELLFGLHVLEETDLSTLVVPEDVIRAGLGLDPDTFPTDRLPDVQRAIDSAVSWVSDDLFDSWGLA